MKKVEKPEENLYKRISENADMGADAISTLMPMVKNRELREALGRQQSAYLSYSAKAASELAKMGVAAETRGTMKKLPARMGIKMNTAMDSSSSRIAELVMVGSDMGVIDMTRAMNRLKENAPEAAVKLGREVIEFEERNIGRMKRFL